MKKTFLTKIIYIFTAIFLLTSNSCAMQNNNSDKKTFWIEKYDKVQDVRLELIKRYPMGSDVENVIEDMKESGFSHVFIDIKNGEGVVNKNNKGKIILFKYSDKKIFLKGKLWYITMYLDKNNKVKEFMVKQEYQGL